MGFVGHCLAAPTMPEEKHPELSLAAMVIANLYGAYVAVGGVAFLASAPADRHGRAMATVFMVVLTSFLLKFVAQLLASTRQVAFLGVLEYCQPSAIVQGRVFPLRIGRTVPHAALGNPESVETVGPWRTDAYAKSSPLNQAHAPVGI